MFRVLPSALVALSPEACTVAESFVASLPAKAATQIRSIRLFGIQARRFDPEAVFEFLIVSDERSVEVRTAVGVARSAVESEGLYTTAITVATADEFAGPPDKQGRALRNARREGVDIWVRAA